MGTTATDFNGAVQVSSKNDPGATFPSAISIKKGVAKPASVTLWAGGEQTLTLTPSSNNAEPAQPASATIVVGPAGLIIKAPKTVGCVPGPVCGPVIVPVEVVDGHGQIDKAFPGTGASASVVLTTSDKSAKYQGQLVPSEGISLALQNGQTKGAPSLFLGTLGAVTLTATDAADKLSASATVLVGGCNIAKTPQYFAGASYKKPPKSKSKPKVTGNWTGTATGSSITSCMLAPGGWNHGHCKVEDGEQVVMMTTVNDKANFEFKVSDDGTVKGDGSVTYSLDVNTAGLDEQASKVRNMAAMGGVPAGVPGYSLRFVNGDETHRFTFKGKIEGLHQHQELDSPCPTDVPPGGTFQVERDKNYETGSSTITLQFPCNGNGALSLTGDGNAVHGTLIPDGNGLYDVCVPDLGVDLSQQPISWNADSQELSLPFLLFGSTGSSGAYTLFKPPPPMQIHEHHNYSLVIESVEVECQDGASPCTIPAVSTVGSTTKTAKMPAFSPIGAGPLKIKRSVTGGYYLYDVSRTANDVAGAREPGIWQRFRHEVTAHGSTSGGSN